MPSITANGTDLYHEVRGTSSGGIRQGRRWSSGAGGDPRVADRGYGGAEGAADGGAGDGACQVPPNSLQSP